MHFTLCLVEQNIWVFELVQPESKPRLDEIDQTTKHAIRFRFPENVILADTPIVPKWMYIKFPSAYYTLPVWIPGFIPTLPVGHCG